MHDGGSGPAICDRDANEQIVRAALGVFGRYVEVAIVVEDAGIRKLELWGFVSAKPVLVDESRVGELGVRVLVERFGVRVRRGRVEVVVALFDVFAAGPLGIGETENPLL